jgi:glutaredoxin
MRALLLLLTVSGAFCAAAAFAGDVYKWTDVDGRVHFGDRPPEGAPAQEIRIRSLDGPAEVTSGVVGNAVDRSVTVFSTVWCSVCKQAKSHLKARGVSFTEYDIEKNSYGKAEFKRLGGKGVPLITVGVQRMSGFSSDRLDKMLKDVGLLKTAGD